MSVGLDMVAPWRIGPYNGRRVRVVPSRRARELAAGFVRGLDRYRVDDQSWGVSRSILPERSFKTADRLSLMKLIIQVPCFNEEDQLPNTLSRLPRDVPGVDAVEWLIIDDGSSDRTSRWRASTASITSSG